MKKIKNWVFNYNFIFAVFAILAIGASLQRYFPAHDFLGRFSYYNNFILFKYSIIHLLQNKDMYIPYENEGAWDLYKYSPTFAVFMLPYAFIPDLPGLILWNLTNMLLVFWAIKRLPGITDKNKFIMLWFVLPELLLSIQSSQSNALMAALYLFTFISFERNRMIPAAIFMCLATCIKPYGVIIGFIFLFYPDKLKFILTSMVVGVLFIALPLLLVSFANLQNQYFSWFNMLSGDYSSSTGLSVMALMNDITGIAIDKKLVMIAGTLLTFSTALLYKRFSGVNFSALFVALLMLWVVIFNHKSESPTFIIPVAGVALWFFSRPFDRFNLLLLLLVLVFTELSSSDIFPPYIRHEIFSKYHVKVIPCFIVWVVIIVQIYLGAFKRESGE